MMTSGHITERRAVVEAIPTMAITMTTAKVRSTRMTVRQGPGKGSVQRMERGNGRGRQPTKGS